MLSWKRRESSESPLIIIYLRPSPSTFLRTEENNGITSSRSTSNNDTANLSATAGFIFPNDHSQQQQQQHPVLRIYSDPRNPKLLFLRHPDWKMEMREVGEETTIEVVYFWRYPRWINDWFLSPVSLRRSVLDAPTDHRQSRSEDIRSQRYLTLITMAMVPGTITNSHILLAVLQQLRAYCSLLTSISIQASISNSYTLHRYRLSFTAT